MDKTTSNTGALGDIVTVTVDPTRVTQPGKYEADILVTPQTTTPGSRRAESPCHIQCDVIDVCHGNPGIGNGQSSREHSSGCRHHCDCKSGAGSKLLGSGGSDLVHRKPEHGNYSSEPDGDLHFGRSPTGRLRFVGHYSAAGRQCPQHSGEADCHQSGDTDAIADRHQHPLHPGNSSTRSPNGGFNELRDSDQLQRCCGFDRKLAHCGSGFRDHWSSRHSGHQSVNHGEPDRACPWHTHRDRDGDQVPTRRIHRRRSR